MLECVRHVVVAKESPRPYRFDVVDRRFLAELGIIAIRILLDLVALSNKETAVAVHN